MSDSEAGAGAGFGAGAGAGAGAEGVQEEAEALGFHVLALGFMVVVYDIYIYFSMKLDAFKKGSGGPADCSV